MKATDLMIGNLAEYNGMTMKVADIVSPKPLKEKRFSDKWLVELFDGAGLLTATIDEISGIPITPELLERAEFDEALWLEINEYLSIEVDIIGGIVQLWSVDSAGNSTFFEVPCKNIHQLQNLYFALTGKELEIK